MHKNQLAFLERYSIERKQPNSDQTVLRQKNSNHLLLMKEVEFQDANHLKQIVETLEAQKALTHDHLLSLLDYFVQQNQQNDVITRKVITFYQYSSHHLLQQIEARIKEQRPFQESEIWSIVCSPTLGLAYLQKESVGHGSVSPIDIFLTQQGSIKIVDPSIASTSPLDFVEGYYYSPQLLQAFSQGKQSYSQMDIFKNDVFSLGMCTLQAALLEPCSDCYDYQSGTFSYEALEQKLMMVGESYSEQLVNLLAMMLNSEVQQRPNFLELEQYLIEALNKKTDDSMDNNNYEEFRNTKPTSSSITNRMLKKQSITDSFLEPMQADEEDIPNCIKFVVDSLLVDTYQIDIPEQDKQNHETKELLKLPEIRMQIPQDQCTKDISRTKQSRIMQRNSLLNSVGRKTITENDNNNYYHPHISDKNQIFTQQRVEQQQQQQQYQQQQYQQQQQQPKYLLMNFDKNKENNKNIFNMSNKKSIIVETQFQKNGSNGAIGFGEYYGNRNYGNNNHNNNINTNHNNHTGPSTGTNTTTKTSLVYSKYSPHQKTYQGTHPNQYFDNPYGFTRVSIGNNQQQQYQQPYQHQYHSYHPHQQQSSSNYSTTANFMKPKSFHNGNNNGNLSSISKISMQEGFNSRIGMNNQIASWNNYEYKPKEQQLFTDPTLLMMMKSDLERINTRSRMDGSSVRNNNS